MKSVLLNLNRPLPELGAGEQMLEDSGAQNRSVLNLHEDSSTESPAHLPAAVELCKSSNILLRRLYLLVVSFCIAWCMVPSSEAALSKKTLIGVTCADYPPFEFLRVGELVGFDIEVARLIAKEAGFDVAIKDMNFSSIISSVQTGRADFGISSLTATIERAKNVDFSMVYYTPHLAMLYNKKNPTKSLADLNNKIIAAQLGSTMESFLRQQLQKGAKFKLIAWAKTQAMVQELKLERIQAVLVELPQARAFASAWPENIAYSMLSSSQGYAVAFQKGSPLKKKFDCAIKNLISSGVISVLEKKWLNGTWP